MARRGRRLSVVPVVMALMLVGQFGLVAPRAAPVLAQDADLATPFLNNGDWSGTLNAAGPFDIEDFHGEVDYSGTFQFTVSGGVITAGTWTIDGAGGAQHPRVTGTVTYEASGPMGGTAYQPQMLPGAITATYDLVVDRVPVSGTTEFGAAEMRTVSVPLVSATCDFAVGDWEVPANMVYQSAGGTASITGFWFAVRTGGQNVVGADPAVLDPMVNALYVRADTFATDTQAAGAVDFDELNALMHDAEYLNRLLILHTQCAGRTLRGWVNPITPLMVATLDWAFRHPDLFDTADLLRLVTAGVRTNAIGSRASRDEFTRALDTAIAMELSRRSQEARQDGDCPEASQIYAAARALDDATVTRVIQGDMQGACE